MTQHLHLLATIGFDTAENEPSKVWYKGLTFYLYPAWIPYLQPRSDKRRHTFQLHLIDGVNKWSEKNWLQYPAGKPFTEL